MMKQASIGLTLLFVFFISACDVVDDQATDKAALEKPMPESMTLKAVKYTDLPGWVDDKHDEAIPSFLKSCERFLTLPEEKDLGTANLVVKAGDWWDACLAAKLGGGQGRAFFERHFDPYLAASSDKGESGLFTGYFEAELRGSKTKSDAYPYPLYMKPNDLIQVNLGQFSDKLSGKHIVGYVKDGVLKPYPVRKEIEAGYLKDKGFELLWINDAVDLFLLQVQGSGRVILENGDVVRVGFAAHNGRPYKSIGSALINQGELTAGQASWDGIKGWIADNPDRAADLFAVNPRFIFFKEIIGDGPIGAQGVALTPERSMAIDRRFVPLGVPVWLDTVKPGGSSDPLQTLLIAQHTGGALKGPVRGDFFWGYGAPALKNAGVMKSRGRYFILLPKATVARLPAS